MNLFVEKLNTTCDKWSSLLQRKELTTLQVNMGNLCNLACMHCHVNASPQGNMNMNREVVDDVISFLRDNNIKTLDLTGGAPELNPNFKYLVTNARPLVDEIIVRTNLTVFFEKGLGNIVEFFKEYRVHIVASLPCYIENNVDKQRGVKTFAKSIKGLLLLNDAGYGTADELVLDLVYNPGGAFLPPAQKNLEQAYKSHLLQEHSIVFNNLITITNVPINRYRNYLENNHEYDSYLKLLGDNFNFEVVKDVMCRNFLSVGYDGKVYDCDFNQALAWNIVDDDGHDLYIKDIKAPELVGRDIRIGTHCLACTAGSGSSCSGALK